VRAQAGHIASLATKPKREWVLPTLPALLSERDMH
jgi:hypothetical protein